MLVIVACAVAIYMAIGCLYLCLRERPGGLGLGGVLDPVVWWLPDLVRGRLSGTRWRRQPVEWVMGVALAIAVLAAPVSILTRHLVLVLMVSAVALGVSFALQSPAAAHPGGLAKDGCHRDRAGGIRHWHFEGTRDLAGACIKENGKTVKVPNIPSLTDVVLELRAAIEALSLRVATLEADAIAAPTETPVRSRLEAYNFCSGELGKDGGLWRSSIDDWCGSIPAASVDDYVSCFQTQRNNRAWGSTSDDRCRKVLGIQ